MPYLYFVHILGAHVNYHMQILFFQMYGFGCDRRSYICGNEPYDLKTVLLP